MKVSSETFMKVSHAQWKFQWNFHQTFIKLSLAYFFQSKKTVFFLNAKSYQNICCFQKNAETWNKYGFALKIFFENQNKFKNICKLLFHFVYVKGCFFHLWLFVWWFIKNFLIVNNISIYISLLLSSNGIKETNYRFPKENARFPTFALVAFHVCNFLM